MSNVDKTLAERGSRYGSFDDNAGYAQAIKDVFRSSKTWEQMTPAQREGLDFIASKMGRILSGDPNYSDSWHDIAGFATLVENSIAEKERERDKEEYNKRVDEDSRRCGGYYNITPQDIIDQAFKYQENGDYDPRQTGPGWWYNPAPLSEAASEPNPTITTVVGVVGGQVLGLCPIWPESEVDTMAPESCVSRCY